MEEVIFLVASVCLFALCTHTKDHYILDDWDGQGQRSNVKVTNVKNVKIPVFSLVSERWSKVKVTGQGHKGRRSRSRGSRSQRSRSLGQGQSCLGGFVPPTTPGRGAIPAN